MNPFEMTAVPFLTLYATLYFAAVLIAWRIRGGNATARDATLWTELTPIDLAWLAGGRVRAGDAAVVALQQHKAATLDIVADQIVPHAGFFTVPPWLAPFRAALGTPIRAREIPATLRTPLDQVGQGLIARGFVPDPPAAAATALLSAIPLFAVCLFGLARMMLSARNGHPIGYLAAMAIAVAIHALFLAFRKPFRTLAGREALAEWRSRHQRLRRAPMETELTMGFALFGAAVLLGTPLGAYANWRGLNTGASSDSSSSGDSASTDSSSDGGSDGGSGCGGCSS
jgi:uncharacterized protein (TIGR04222 family)